MVIAQEHGPLVLRPGNQVELPINLFGGASPAKAKGARVARIVQGMQRRRIQQRSKMQFASMRASVNAAGKEHPLSRKYLTVARAEPVRWKVANKRRSACWTWASGSSAPSHLRRRPAQWARAVSTPRAAHSSRMPPCKRARNTCSSASDIAPFNPSKRRSLKAAGS